MNRLFTTIYGFITGSLSEHRTDVSLCTEFPTNTTSQVSTGNDALYQKAWNAIGDYYADRLKWGSAVSYYQQSQNIEKLVTFFALNKC